MAAVESVSLVQAVESDAELLFSYMRQLRQDDPMPRHEFADDAAVRNALGNLIRDSSLGRVWLIRDGEEAVGYAAMAFFHSMEFAGRCGLLDEFFIDLNHRRRGIGRAALKWIGETAAADLGIRALFLEVSPKNGAATALYISERFTSRPYQMMMKYTSPPGLR